MTKACMRFNGSTWVPTGIARRGSDAWVPSMISSISPELSGSITYAIGAGGAAPSGATDGNAGEATTVSFNGVNLIGEGGQGGLYNSVSSSGGAGAGYGGGDGGSSGGDGGRRSGDEGGGGGGAIGGVSDTSPQAANGGDGAQAADVDGLQAAVVAAGEQWAGPGAGSPSRVGGQINTNNGGDATGFGCGGGGAGYYGGNGGAGRLGGGGGGAAGYTGLQTGGAGGDGAVVCKFMQYSTTQCVVLTSGTSYPIPTGTIGMQVWAIGAGGSGAGCADTDTSSGSAGGAGGVAYKKWGTA